MSYQSQASCSVPDTVVQWCWPLDLFCSQTRMEPRSTVFSWSLNFHRNAKIILLESECFQRVALMVLYTLIQNNSIPFLTPYAAINKGLVLYLNAEVKHLEENIAVSELIEMTQNWWTGLQKSIPLPHWKTVLRKLKVPMNVVHTCNLRILEAEVRDLLIKA